MRFVYTMCLCQPDGVHRSRERLRRRTTALPSIILLLIGCGVRPTTVVTDAPREDELTNQPCFDEIAASQVTSVKLRYGIALTGTLEVDYRTQADSGRQLLRARVTTTMADFSSLQEMVFTLPELANVTMRNTSTGGSEEYVIADLAVNEGEVRGRSMRPGGEMVAVSAPVGVDVLLPGAARALLPFFRLESCKQIALPAFYPPNEQYDLLITVGGARVVDVPAGRFAATEIIVSGRSGESTYLVRAESPHFVLRIVYPGTGGVVELVDIIAVPS